MPAESRENPLLKKGNSDAFFKEKYLTKNIDKLSRKRLPIEMKILMRYVLTDSIM